MARTKEQQRTANNAKQAAYRAKKKAEATAAATQTPGVVAPVAGMVATPGNVDGLQVDVKVADQQPPKLSLKDRILGKIAPTATTPTVGVKKPAASKPKKSGDNLITSAMPTVIAAFVATYSKDLVTDPYKSCAPSQEEVSSVIGPLFDILGREVELTGKASQNTIDLMNSLICGMMYGLRAYMTYRQIKAEEETPGHAQTQRQAYRDKLDREAREYNDVINEQPDLAGGMRSHQAAATGLNGYNHSRATNAIHDIAAEADAEGGNAHSDDGNTEGKPTEASIISAMLRRDIEGRKRLGLLPV